MNKTSPPGAPRPRLGADFYQRPDPVALARELLGKRLATCFDGRLTVGRIVETEAYRAPDDKACHAHLNRFTQRTRVMFEPGGRAYIYLCYGIHHLFNIVTGPEGMAHVVLVRAIEPLLGLETMLERRNMRALTPQLTAGPGVMSQAMGLHKTSNGASMLAPDAPIWVEDADPAREPVACGPRIGIDYAEECVQWPWRFWLEGNPWVSRPKKR